MKKYVMILMILVGFSFSPQNLHAQNDVMMQAFYWDVPVDVANLNGTWWDNLSGKATELKNAGISGIWVPAPSKGNWGIEDMGYGVHDHYDLGNYNQKGSVETRFGSRAELESMISAMHSTSGGAPRINVYADAVLNHVYSNASNEQVNPAVKQYVFDQAYRSGTQYVPYPTNEIKWVIPNAAAGDYYIKIKGYVLNWGGSENERAYDVQIDWTSGGFNSTYSWESEPNGGGGQFDVFPGTGQTVRGFIASSSDIDEYKVTLSTSNDIVIALTARRNVDGWNWANQENGYYPVEIWYNGQNVATNTLQARTNTSLTFPTHTGTGEANFSWTYTDFHPVDQNDFLTNWDWNGGNSAIIPNTKGFGNDFNTYSSTVQTRLNNWGYWMANTVGFDGFRLDFVRGFQTSFVASWVSNLPLQSGSQRFIVGEYWGPDVRIKEWVNGVAGLGADVDAFDFPLKTSLSDMCNGSSTFDMRWLNNAGMVRNNSGNSLSGTSVVTWLENHDTGKEHDKWVTKDWKMGYAYILTHEGRPCVFYPHFYGVTLVDAHNSSYTVSIPSGLKEDIKKLTHVRKTYLGGGLTVLSQSGNPYPSGDAHDVYVARRAGNGSKSGAIIVINDHESQTKGLWVDAAPSGWASWSNTTLVDAFNSSTTTQVYSDGRVWVQAPPRGYAVYVKQSEYVAYSGGSRLGDLVEPMDELKQFKINNLYPNPVSNGIVKLDVEAGEAGALKVQVIDLSGRTHMTREFGLNGQDSFNINVAGLASGYYLFKVYFKGEEQTLPVIINN